ncbi:hypothetical protein ACHQM5_030552 [Ranunculus cassubicifolius]
MEQLKQLHSQIFKIGLNQNRATLEELMLFCTHSGQHLRYASQIFTTIHEPTLFTYNLLIKAYAKKGLFLDIVSLFVRLRKDGLFPSNFTYPFVCKAIGWLKKDGRSVHGLIIATGFEFDCYTRNSLVDMYANCGCLGFARQVFDEMLVKNVVTWSTMMYGYANNGMMAQARELFDACPEKEVHMWTTMIIMYVQSNSFDEALKLFHAMRVNKGVKPDKYTVVALLQGCAKFGGLEKGRWIHGYIEDKRIRIDAIVGTALINMYASFGCMDKSMEIFRSIRKKDTTLWSAIIWGFAINAKTKEALNLFGELRNRLKPDANIYRSVLTACRHGGLVEKGRLYFEFMQKIHRIEPKIEHYMCLVDLLSSAGELHEAERLIEGIPNVSDHQRSLPLWNALLCACRTHNNVEMGKRVAKHILASNSGDPSLSANLYAAVDGWDDGTTVRKKMKELTCQDISSVL